MPSRTALMTSLWRRSIWDYGAPVVNRLICLASTFPASSLRHRNVCSLKYQKWLQIYDQASVLLFAVVQQGHRDCSSIIKLKALYIYNDPSRFNSLRSTTLDISRPNLQQQPQYTFLKSLIALLVSYVVHLIRLSLSQFRLSLLLSHVVHVTSSVT
jgi:hypothetical protein